MSSINTNLQTMQNATAALQYEQSKESMGNTSLSKDSFLRLMIEQMRNQDPLNPMDNSQMLQQQATLTQVEELQNLNKSLTQSNSLSQASSLIGKQVTVHNPDDLEQTYTGTVSAAYVTSDGSAIEMDGVLFPLELIDKIENVPAQTAS